MVSLRTFSRLDFLNNNNNNVTQLKFKALMKIYYKIDTGGARCVYGKGSQRILVGRPEGKGPLGIPGLTWEDNIKMDLQEVGFASCTC